MSILLTNINDKLKSGVAFLILETASCLTRLINLCFYISNFRMKIREKFQTTKSTIHIYISAERTVGNLKRNELPCSSLLQNILIKYNITSKVPIFEVIFSYQMNHKTMIAKGLFSPSKYRGNFYAWHYASI